MAEQAANNGPPAGRQEFRVLARLAGYFAQLRPGKVILRCYLIWYLGTVAQHFDPSPRIWLNALGISAVVGLALVLSVGQLSNAIKDRWQLFRLFAMPFGVSSFSTLIKGQDFWVVIPPDAGELAASAGACVLFLILVLVLKRRQRRA